MARQVWKQNPQAQSLWLPRNTGLRHLSEALSPGELALSSSGVDRTGSDQPTRSPCCSWQEVASASTLCSATGCRPRWLLLALASWFTPSSYRGFPETCLGPDSEKRRCCGWGLQRKPERDQLGLTAGAPQVSAPGFRLPLRKAVLAPRGTWKAPGTCCQALQPRS